MIFECLFGVGVLGAALIASVEVRKQKQILKKVEIVKKTEDDTFFDTFFLSLQINSEKWKKDNNSITTAISWTHTETFLKFTLTPTCNQSIQHRPMIFRYPKDGRVEPIHFFTVTQVNRIENYFKNKEMECLFEKEN